MHYLISILDFKIGPESRIFLWLMKRVAEGDVTDDSLERDIKIMISLTNWRIFSRVDNGGHLTLLRTQLQSMLNLLLYPDLAEYYDM